MVFSLFKFRLICHSKDKMTNDRHYSGRLLYYALGINYKPCLNVTSSTANWQVPTV